MIAGLVSLIVCVMSANLSAIARKLIIAYSSISADFLCVVIAWTRKLRDAARLLLIEKESIGQDQFTRAFLLLPHSILMCAMYKPAIWQFANPLVPTTYDSTLAPFNNADSLVIRWQEQSRRTLTQRQAGLIGQRFSIALSEELLVRGLAAKRTVMRTVINTERLRSGRNRTRVELDVIAHVPKATPSQLIDALSAAKRKCANSAGPGVKILLKAELKMD